MVAFQLTTEQLAALGDTSNQGAVPVFDPRDNRTYFLVPAETYEQLRRGEGDEVTINENLYAMMDEVARREGWDDPEMDAYDPLKNSSRS
jgi:hypothetical protein